MLRRGLLTVACLGLLFGGVGCDQAVGNSGGRVGGPCATSAECTPPDARCQTGFRYPEGYCTLDCVSAEDCPTNRSACADDPDFGDLCMFVCDEDSDCRDGYTCTELPAGGPDGVGTVMVCSNPAT